MYDDIFTFSLDDEDFGSQIVKWYDAGKPEYVWEDGSEEDIFQFILSEFDPVDVIRGTPRRWNVWVDFIYKINGRYFKIGYDQGLTEAQEDEYYNTDMEEVEPQEQVITVTNWIPKKEKQ